MDARRHTAQTRFREVPRDRLRERVPATSVPGAARLRTTQLSPPRLAGMALVLVALVLGLRLGAPRDPATAD